MSNNKGKDIFLQEFECPVCGKLFFATGMHVYKDRRVPYGKVCSWSCVCKSERLKQEKSKLRKGDKAK